MSSSSSKLLDDVVDLINKAKLEAKEQKIYLLIQVKETCMKRDSSLLAEVIPMVAEFQTDFNANCRKFVAGFLREVVRAHPQHVSLVVPVASYLMHDSSTVVKKNAILLANTIYRPALQRLVDNGSAKGAQQDWSTLDGLRKVVLNTITSGPADISMVAVKFAESVVLACVGGRGLAPGASREGDKSVQRNLSPSHPFLLADTLDQAGHALARQMVGWLGTSDSDSGVGGVGGVGVGGASGGANASAGTGGGGAAKGTGWGSGFGAPHYTVLINALQNLATNRAALFADIVPALASALESVNGNGNGRGKAAVAGVGGKKGPAVAAAVPKGLRDAGGSLRSACLKLLKVAPGPSKSVQKLAVAAALSGSDGEAKAAVDGNATLKGRIKLPVRVKERPVVKAAPTVRTLEFSAEDRRAFADLAASVSLGKMPKPPPGYKQNRTKGFPLPDLETLFGHVLNAVGPGIAAAKCPPVPKEEAKEALTSVRSREVAEKENRERLEKERKAEKEKKERERKEREKEEKRRELERKKRLEKERELRAEKEKLLSARAERNRMEEDLVDFEGDEEEEEEEEAEEEEEKEEEEDQQQQEEEEEKEKEAKEEKEDKRIKSEAPVASSARASASASTPAAAATAATATAPATDAAEPAAAPATGATGVRVVGPWLSPPESEGAARVRLSLYFALCVKSRSMLSGLIEAYVTASPAAQAGLMAELPLLAKAAARAFGEPGVVGLMAAAPEGAKGLILVMLDLLVPRETNKPSPELVAAVRRLRDARVAKAAEVAAKAKAAAAAAAAGVKMEEEEEEVKPPDTGGIEYIVPVLGGLGREGVTMALPSLLQADDQTIRAAFRRLTQPAKGATYTPAELVVLLNQYDFTAAGVHMKRLTRALSLCMDNKTVYNYPVLREALNVMSQVPPPGEERKEIPLFLMRTVMVSVATFPELKNFVATVVLVRLVQLEVWTQHRIWGGFLRCAKMMAKESGATSFIALVQLPGARLKEALDNPLLKGVKEPLRRYAHTLVKVDDGVKAVLGMDTATRQAVGKK